MKKILTLFVLGLSLHGWAQNKPEAERLVNSGIQLHDKGDYTGAISRYDQALQADKDNLLALVEKAYSLNSLRRYEESIACCKRAIETHPGEEDLNMAFVTYGNSLDALGRSEESVRIYEEGMRMFPDFYMLPFNKGITLTGMKKYDEALLCFQKSVTLNPMHPGSHNAMSKVLMVKNQRIPSLLASCRFLVIERSGERAASNRANIEYIMGGDVQKTGSNSITINVSPDMLDTTVKENNFSHIDLVMAMGAALNLDKAYAKETNVQRFIRNFTSVCSMMEETKAKNSGFYWEYYAPYFIDMKKHNLVETFGYIIYSGSDDKGVAKWIKAHPGEIESFIFWSSGYDWNKKN